MLRLALVLLLLAIGAISSPSANAGLGFCNNTGQVLWLAVGWLDDDNGWVSSGWYQLQPQQCAPLFDGPLSNRYYYFYANNDNGKLVWSGDSDSNSVLHSTSRFLFPLCFKLQRT
jgi:uncharacterized membrane protein